VGSCFSMIGATGKDDDDRNKFHATLRGINETPGPVATQATGTFDATLSDDGTTLTYTLTYNNLNAQVTQSHVHFGFPKETGGIMFFFFPKAPAPPPPTPPRVPTPPDTTPGPASGPPTPATILRPNTHTLTP